MIFLSLANFHIDIPVACQPTQSVDNSESSSPGKNTVPLQS